MISLKLTSKMTLDCLLGIFLFAILFALFTGGFIYKGDHFKFELSQLDPWVVGFLSVLYIRTKLGPSYFWNAIKILVQKMSLPIDSLIKWVLGIVIFFSLIHALRYLSFNTDAYDVLFIHQPLFHPFSSLGEPTSPFLRCDLCLGGSYLGDHLAMTLIPFSFLFQFFKTVPFIDLSFFLLESLLVLLSLTFVSRSIIKKDIPIVLFILLCHRALRNSLIWDLREDHIAFAALCVSLIFIFKNRFFLAVFAAILAILCKENIGIVTAFMATALFFDRNSNEKFNSQRKKAAILLFFFSIGWTILSFFYLIPIFNEGLQTSNNIVVRFPGLGNTPSEVLIYLLSHPMSWIEIIQKNILSVPGIKYLLWLLGPYLYLMRKKRIWLIAAIPAVVMNLFSGVPQQRSMIFHYELIILPFLFVPTLFGLKELIHARDSKKIALALVFALAFSGRWPSKDLVRYWPNFPQLKDALFFATLSPNEITAGGTKVLAHLSRLDHLRSYPPIPQNLSAAQFGDWLSGQSKDRTGLKSHRLSEANRLIIDRQSADELRLGNILETLGYRSKLSPSGRFQIYSLDAPINKLENDEQPQEISRLKGPAFSVRQ